MLTADQKSRAAFPGIVEPDKQISGVSVQKLSWMIQNKPAVTNFLAVCSKLVI